MKTYSAISVMLILSVALFTGCSEPADGEPSEASAMVPTADPGTVADVDKPEGFAVNVVAPHAPFGDELSAQFRLRFAGDNREAIVSNLNDASTVIFATVDWEPGGTSGWHRHPGLAIVNVIEGELEATWKRECTTRTYRAGESFFDPGEIHNVDNLSNTDRAKAYVTFLGIPDGAPATEWVEPADC